MVALEELKTNDHCHNFGETRNLSLSLLFHAEQLFIPTIIEAPVSGRYCESAESWGFAQRGFDPGIVFLEGFLTAEGTKPSCFPSEVVLGLQFAIGLRPIVSFIHLLVLLLL